jgi:rare lipoprotein A
VTALADRYAGRHIRQARHGAWVNKKRSRTKTGSQFLPAAAALTIAGILAGGAGAAIHLNPAGSESELGLKVDPADIMPPDRSAQMPDRTSRSEARADTGTAVSANGLASAGQPAPAGPAVLSSGSCEASYYDEGQRTANGETFNPDALTAAHASLPFNSLVRVTNPASGESVVVRINDRWPARTDRCLDLSRAAFSSIASLGQGIVDVRYEVLAQEAT